MKLGLRTIYAAKVDFVGNCEKCKEPATGHFYSDDDCDEDSHGWVTLECVNCHDKTHYCFDPELGAIIGEERNA